MKILILMYHGFTDQKHVRGIENNHGKHMLVDKFEEQVRYLKDNYNVISLEDLVDSLSRHRPLPPRSVVITMDDGYRSNFILAYPVLCKHQAPATIFIATDFVCKKDFLWVDRIEYALNTTSKKHLELAFEGRVDKYDLSTENSRRMADQSIKARLKRSSFLDRGRALETIERQLQQKLSWDRPFPPAYAPLEKSDIQEMAGSGLVTVGSHTSSHIILTALSLENMNKELKESKVQVEKLTGRPCVFFCYPNGEKGDFNGQTKQFLKDLGFKCALTTVIGSNHTRSDIFELKRLNLHNDGDMTGFVRTLSGMGRFLRRLKNAVIREKTA